MIKNKKDVDEFWNQPKEVKEFFYFVIDNLEDCVKKYIVQPPKFDKNDSEQEMQIKLAKKFKLQDLEERCCDDFYQGLDYSLKENYSIKLYFDVNDLKEEISSTIENMKYFYDKLIYNDDCNKFLTNTNITNYTEAIVEEGYRDLNSITNYYYSKYQDEWIDGLREQLNNDVDDLYKQFQDKQVENNQEYEMER